VLRLIPGGVGEAGQYTPVVGADARRVLALGLDLDAATLCSPILGFEKAHPHLWRGCGLISSPALGDYLP